MKRFLLVLSIALCAGMMAAAQHYQEVVYLKARPLISVSYYHTLGIGSGLFKNVSLPSLRR